MSQYRVGNKDRSASTIFLNLREELGDAEAATQAFVKSMENFGISEEETRHMLATHPGIIDLAIRGLTGKQEN